MSMMIGTATVVNPFYDGGYARERDLMVGRWRFLAGDRGRHFVVGQWKWSIVWRVLATDYDDLMAALAAVEQGTFTLTDHLGNSETCELDGNPKERLMGNTVHEVTATFVEVTA